MFDVDSSCRSTTRLLLTEEHGLMRERDLDPELVEAELDQVVEGCFHRKMFHGLGPDPGLEDHGAVTELVEAKNLDRLQDLRLPILACLELVADTADDVEDLIDVFLVRRVQQSV